MADKKTRIPYIKKLTAIEGLRFAVTWKDGTTDIVDMAGTIPTVVGMAELADPGLFATAKIVSWGRAVEWENGIDYSADSIHELALEQSREFTGKAFKVWQSAIGLSNAEAAGVFDVDISTIKNYRAKTKPLPRVVRFACDALAGSDLMVRAHRHPRRAGRPRLAAKTAKAAARKRA